MSSDAIDAFLADLVDLTHDDFNLADGIPPPPAASAAAAAAPATRTAGKKRCRAGAQPQGWRCSICTVTNAPLFTACCTCGAIPGVSVVCEGCGEVSTQSGQIACLRCSAPLPPVPGGSSSSAANAHPPPVNDEVQFEEISSDDDSLDNFRPPQAPPGDEILAPEDVARVTEGLVGADVSHLPAWKVPDSMSQHASLMEYQLQGIHWMLGREVCGMGPPQRIVSRPPTRQTSSITPTSSSGTLAAEVDAPALVIPSTPAGVVREIQSLVERLNSTVGTGPHAPRIQAPKLDHPGGILADYMGLGKTRTVIGLVEASREMYASATSPLGRTPSLQKVYTKATLIIAPATLIQQWKQEILATVTPPPRILMFYGSTPARRQTSFYIADNYDYVITSTGVLNLASDHSDSGKLLKIVWRRVVIDEAHCTRNNGAADNYFHLESTCRWAVTATPVVNRRSDIRNLFRFLGIDALSSGAFWGQMARATPSEATRLVNLALSTIMVRRGMASTIRGQPILLMPPKTVETVEVDVTGPEKRLHDLILEEGKIRCQERGVSAAFALTLLVRCRQACLTSNSFRDSISGALGQELRRLVQYSEQSLQSLAGKIERASKQMPMDKQWLTQLQTYMTRLGVNVSFVETVLSMVREMRILQEECVVCLDTVDKPAILPCGHVFCKACITHCFQVAIGEKRCPMCKTRCHMQHILEVPECFTVGAPVPPSSPPSASLTASKERTTAALATRKELLRSLEGASTLSHLQHPSARAEAIVAYISTRPKADEKVLVLCEFAPFIQVLQASLQAKGISCAIFDSSISIPTRDRFLKDFNRIQGGSQVLITTIKMCGVGLNLIRANHCILCSPHWSPAVEEQAMNRLHRIGQRRPVYVVRFMSRGTVEEGVFALCNARRQQSNNNDVEEPSKGEFARVLNLYGA